MVVIKLNNKKKIAFFETKPYDKIYFDKLSTNYEITYFEEKLNKHTAKFIDGFDAVCAFVGSDIDSLAIERLYNNGIRIIAMRCAGFSNVDLKSAKDKITILRVPAYSPYAIAEHTLALLLSLNRKIHKAYIRTKDFNFNIDGFMGIDLHGKNVGIIGMGKIGKAFASICIGLGMNVYAYDPYAEKTNTDKNIKYTNLETLYKECDVISLHCPLTESTYHIIDKKAFSLMKDGAFLLNTSRGSLVDSEELLEVLNKGKLKGAALDVYEEEANIFYEDMSGKIMRDDTLALLISKPNVLITSHQAFLTEEALKSIAEVTVSNLDDFFSGKELVNKVSM